MCFFWKKKNTAVREVKQPGFKAFIFFHIPRTDHSKVLLWWISPIFLDFILVCQNILFYSFRFKQMYLFFWVVKIRSRQLFLYELSILVPAAWHMFSNICYSTYYIVNHTGSVPLAENWNMEHTLGKIHALSVIPACIWFQISFPWNLRIPKIQTAKTKAIKTEKI